MRKKMKVITRFVGIAAVSAALAIPAPSAVAAPACDWNTDEGTQACMGGGPFDAGKNGHGDTYGPTGEAGFLQDQKVYFPRISNDQLLKVGYAICKDTANGVSHNAMRSALMGRGLDETSAGAVVISAQMFLCSGLTPVG